MRKKTIYLVRKKNTLIYATDDLEKTKKFNKDCEITKVKVPEITDVVYETVEYETVEGHQICLRGIYTDAKDVPHNTYYSHIKLNESVKDRLKRLANEKIRAMTSPDTEVEPIYLPDEI